MTYTPRNELIPEQPPEAAPPLGDSREQSPGPSTLNAREKLLQSVEQNQRPQTASLTEAPAPPQAVTQPVAPNASPVFDEPPQRLGKRTVIVGGLAGGAGHMAINAGILAAQGSAVSPLPMVLPAFLSGIETYIGGKMHNMVWAKKDDREESSALWTTAKGFLSPITVPVGIIRNLTWRNRNDMPADTLRVSKGSVKSALVLGGLGAGISGGLAIAGGAAATAALAPAALIGGIGALLGGAIYFRGEMFKQLWGAKTKEQRQADRERLKGTWSSFWRGLVPFGTEVGLIYNLSRKNEEPQAPSLQTTQAQRTSA